MGTTPAEFPVRRVTVIGAGAMGSQIGAVAALAGFDTVVQDIAREQLDRAAAEIRQRLDASVAKGRRSAEAVAEAAGRLRYTTDLAEAAAQADYLIEAATERLDVKRGIFARLDAAAPPAAILATNSSTYGSSAVADATARPGQIVNLHFFNPALVMRAVEIVRGPHTTESTVGITVELARRLGKNPVVLNREIPGFVANRLMGAIRDEALALYSDGIASIPDIDTAARDALGHPLGPFQLMDLVGLDVSYLIRQATHELSKDPKDLPHPELVRRYEQGHYGRKTGKGWYDYDQD